MSTENNRPVHSPLGASGAERWMNCPGSVALLKLLTLDESDEEDYRELGTAAHEAAAKLLCTSQDAWEVVGETFNGQVVDVNMADAVQVYLDTVRPDFDRCIEGRQVFIEYPVSSPKHPLFYGTVDNAVIVAGPDFHKQENLILSDYKHGEGIAVDVEHNPQLMYYAFGFLEEYPEIDKVTLRIVQPRAFHEAGTIRVWETTAKEIREWAEKVLIPAMDDTSINANLDAGPWCRFCPAKLVCPLLSHLFKAACTANPATVVNADNASLGRSYQYTQAVKFYLKALETEAYRRLNSGQVVPGIKLVPKRANRVYKTDASKVFQAAFGAEAMTKAELKSPAEMAKLGPAAAKLVAEYAFTPQTGFTVALADDKRVEVKVQTTAQAFGPALAALALTAQPDELETGIALTAAIAEHLAEDDELDIPAFLRRKNPVDNQKTSA